MAKNLRKFTTEIEYSAATLNYPSVSWVTSGDTVHYDKRPPFKNYFRTVARGNGDIKFTINAPTSALTSISYSTDSGSTWTTVQNVDNTSVNAIVTGLTSGDTVYWKGDGISMGWQYFYSCKFSASTDYDVEGNIMSLLYDDNFESATTLTSSWNFYELFLSDTHLINASGLTLPATTLTDGCYASMFSYCTSLATAPALPATTLANNCYHSMFGNCTSLTTAPELPATNLIYKNSCYTNMFYNCTSLTTAPTLPAPTLANRCYYQMFQGCTSLSAVTCLATNISASYCTRDWLNNVSASGVFTKATSMTGWTTGDSGIPSGWTTQNYGGGGGVEPENPEPEVFD